MSPHEDPQLEVRAREVAQMLDKICNRIYKQTNRRVGFMVMLFDFGESGFMSYMSNATRETMVEAMEEWIARSKAGEL